MHRGYVKLWRKIQQNDFWTSEKFTRGQAWVDLLLMASHKDVFYYKRGIRVDLKRGQVGKSIVELADRWKWGRSKVNRFLDELEIAQQIVQQKNKVTTTIIIRNYDEYNQQTEQQTEQQIVQQTVQQTNTYKNVKEVLKNVKEVKNEKKIKKFVTPSLQEAETYIQEQNLSVNATTWYSFYEANGWKVGRNPMKNWKASLSYWNNNSNTGQGFKEKEKSSAQKEKEKFNPDEWVVVE